MRETVKRWHSIVLQAHQAAMYESLVWAHNITTESAKAYQFEDAEGIELARPIRGYFAMKDVDSKKTKYFIEEQYYPQLPIRVNDCEEIFFKDSARAKSVVLRPSSITPFKIRPEKCWDSNREFIDTVAPFNHSHPDQWTLSKLLAVQGYVGKTFCGVCSLSEFGKSSIYLILDTITKKCPTFQPRSVPGVLAQITQDGNMVFDEVHDAPSEVKSCMENFSLIVAGNSPIYINGAQQAKNTKAKYDVSQQSITYLFNVYSNYKEPDKQFWNYIWSNRKAMESRFLCLKFEGKLLEEFDKDFDIPKVAEENKMFYMKIAKHLLYLKGIKLRNEYKLRYVNNTPLDLKGRHKILYDELLWIIDLYCNDQAEFDKFVRLLNSNICEYQKMIQEPEPTVFRGDLSQNFIAKSDSQRVLELLEGRDMISIDEIEGRLKLKDTEGQIADMLLKGVLYQPRSGFVGVLK